MIIKDPFYRCAGDRIVVIRVDDPSMVEFIQSPEIQDDYCYSFVKTIDK